jgi:hypothetical protein
MKMWPIQDACGSTAHTSFMQHEQSIVRSEPTRQHDVKHIQSDDGHIVITDIMSQ